MYKKATLIIIVTAVSGWFWVAVKPWVNNPTRFAQVGSWLGPLILLTLLAALTALAFTFLRSRGLQLLVSVASCLPFFLVFTFNGIYLAAFALMVLLQLYAASNIQAEASERTKINIRLILQRGLSMIIMPLLIMVSFAFYLSPGLQATATQKKLPSTIRQVIENTVSGFLGEQIKTLPPQQQQQAKSQITAQVIDQLTSFLGPYFKFMPPILAFGLFLVLEGLSFIFIWLSVLFGALMFWVLKKSGIFRIRVVQKTAEELEF